MRIRFLSFVRPACLLTAAICVASAIPACSSKTKRPERARAVTPVIRDVPSPLRGTVGAEAVFEGIDSTLVSGYGFVVGLNGTGGGQLTEAVAGHMERMMALRGISRAGRVEDTLLETPDGRGMTPGELLRDPNTAVVLVYAQIPPGAPKGMSFDVFVQALNATSLEGGRLWTSELQLGRSEVYQGYQKHIIGEARGDVLVNPFEDPANPRGDVNMDIGRVLAGGIVTSPLEIAITLDNPSHSRARAIASAINSRFPPGPGDRRDTARGRDDSTVAVTIPSAYRERPGDFVKMIQHLPIDQRIPGEIHAQRLLEGLESNPELFLEIMWALRAVGERAIPELRKAYDADQEIVRLTALRAGAFLGDVRASDPLIELATGDPNADVRMEAIEMLRFVDAGPRVDAALRGLVNESDPLIRVRAYEALARRAERTQLAQLRGMPGEQLASASRELSPAEMEVLSRLWLSGDTIHGVRRRLVDSKFMLDALESDSPLVYFTQQDEARIAVLGDARLQRPLLISAWDDRFILVSDGPSDPHRLMYKDYRTGRVSTLMVPENLAEFVAILGHTPTAEAPEPGLGMSYSEVVGVLHALHEAGALNGVVLSEQDRLLRELLEANESRIVEDRPERPGDDPRRYRLPTPDLPGQEPTTPVDDGSPRVVPLTPAGALGEGG